MTESAYDDDVRTALDRLIRAADNRDNHMGDPVRYLATQAELREASQAGRDAMTKENSMSTWKTFEFTIKCVGHGIDAGEAWESVLDSEYLNGIDASDANPVMIEEEERT
jgi:hypothetical protein